MKTIAAFLLLSGALSVFVYTEYEPETETVRSPASIPDKYDSLDACKKQDYLWGQIQASQHKELPPYRKFGLFQLMGMSVQKIGYKGELHSDIAPKGWKKYLHRRGAIAKVKFVPREHSYTGVFEGAECALLRLSLTYRVTGKRPVAPGLAFKILRDNAPSANISALVSLDGQEKDFAFFKNPMSNIVPTGNSLGQKLVHKIFRKVTRYPEELLLTDMAGTSTDGQKVQKVVSPRQIFFVPDPELKFSSDEHDVREDFFKIPEATTVYKVYALSDKYRNFDYTEYDDEKAKEFLKHSEHIGDIVTTSEFIASQFGDDGIFFRHELRK